jgi:hypothetical protein
LNSRIRARIKDRFGEYPFRRNQQWLILFFRRSLLLRRGIGILVLRLGFSNVRPPGLVVLGFLPRQLRFACPLVGDFGARDRLPMKAP